MLSTLNAVVLYKAYTNLKMKMAALSKSAGGNKESRLEVFWCIAIPICYHSRPIAKKCKRQYWKTLRSVSVYCNPHLLSFKTPENCGRWIQFQTSRFLVWSYTTMINEWEIKIYNCYLIKKYRTIEKRAKFSSIHGNISPKNQEISMLTIKKKAKKSLTLLHKVTEISREG